MMHLPVRHELTPELPPSESTGAVSEYIQKRPELNNIGPCRHMFMEIVSFFLRQRIFRDWNSDTLRMEDFVLHCHDRP